jgi:hypothetical protein
MPATTQFRLTEADRERLKELGRLFGTPSKPMAMADVLRRLIWDRPEAETSRQKKTSKKSAVAS